MEKKKEKTIAKKPDILGIMAVKYNLDQKMFLETIKATVMKPGKNAKVPSNEEVAAFLIVANKYNLDPFTNEIYAFPDKKGGVVPVVGVDGFVTIMNRHLEFDGFELEYSEDDALIEGAKACPEWAEVKIYHKNRQKPTIVREYLDEVYIPPRGDFKGPWQSHTKRMLRHKVLIQAIRVAFGITGIYDPDEADRILDAQVIEPTTKPDVAIPQSKTEALPEKKKEDPVKGGEQSSGPGIADGSTPSQQKALYTIGAKLYGSKEKFIDMLGKELSVEHTSQLTKKQAGDLLSKMSDELDKKEKANG